MRKVFLQIELHPEEASVKGVRAKLSLKPKQIDPAYGVRQLRPNQKQYVVRVDADVAQRVRGVVDQPRESGDVRVALVH